MTRADQRKFHYIYKITRNDGSGKYYIGMHSTDDLEDGYFGSGQLLWKSIAKHGKEMHSKEILEFLPSRRELKTRERELVNEEIVNDPLCMNLKLGGEGGWDHIPSDKKVAGAKATNAKIWAEGSKFRRDHKERCSKKSNFNQPHRNLVGFSGRNHLDSSKRIMSEKAALRTGEKNSQFNSCWVCNPDQVLKIKLSELPHYLARGFVRGRKWKHSS